MKWMNKKVLLIFSLATLTAILSWPLVRVLLCSWSFKLRGHHWTRASVECLRYDNGTTRGPIVADLARAGTVAIPALVEGLQHENPHVRDGAAESLGRMAQREWAARGEIERQALPALLGLLEDDDLKVQAEAALAIWRIRREPRDVLTKLIRCCEEGDLRTKFICWTAFIEMGELAKEAETVLRKGLDDESDFVRLSSEEVLSHVAPKQMKSRKHE
jgi:hypothetical protein